MSQSAVTVGVRSGVPTLLNSKQQCKGLVWAVRTLSFDAASSRSRCSLQLPKAASGTDTASKGLATSYVTPEARQALFATAKQQYPEAEAHLVSGRVPSWLKGSLALNGCGEFKGMLHLFDGFACITRVALDGSTGRVTASQRFLETDAYGSFRRTGSMRYREFLTPVPAEGALGRAAVVAGTIMAMVTGGRAFTDNACVSLTHLPTGDLLALSEARPAAYLVDPSSLATLRPVEYSDGLPGDLNTAHPKLAPDGRLVNFSRSLPFGGFHVYLQDPNSLERRQIAFIPDRDPQSPCWVHDMALTANHLIIVEPPLYMNMSSLMLGTKREFAFMDWKPEDGTRVHVVALDGSGVVTHTAPPLFTFHFANAFERATPSSGSEICVDFSVYDDPEIVNDLNLDRLMAFPGKDISQSWLRRLTIPLRDPAGELVGPTTLAAPTPLLRDEDSYGNFMEFPAFNPRHRGKPYRYVYGTAAVRPTNVNNALARFDLETGISRLWHEPGSMATEPAFVPRPDGTSEDDGVVLSLVSRYDGSSHLVILDGTDLTEVARVELPFTVPYRFHGTFVADGTA